MKIADLRAVIVRFRVSAQEPGTHEWRKVAQAGQLEPVQSPALAVTWLESHGYRQHGAMIGVVPMLAVVWLKENDQPEHLEPILGERIVPATCAWYPSEAKIGTTRTAGQIRRDRRHQGQTRQDLAYVERPTWAALMRCYGLTTDQTTIMEKGC